MAYKCNIWGNRQPEPLGLSQDSWLPATDYVPFRGSQARGTRLRLLLFSYFPLFPEQPRSQGLSQPRSQEVGSFLFFMVMAEKGWRRSFFWFCKSTMGFLSSPPPLHNCIWFDLRIVCVWVSDFVDLHRSDPDFRRISGMFRISGFLISAWQIWRKNSAGLYWSIIPLFEGNMLYLISVFVVQYLDC